MFQETSQGETWHPHRSAGVILLQRGVGEYFELFQRLFRGVA